MLYQMHLGGVQASWLLSALDSGVSGSGLSLGQGHCAVFLGKTLSHSISTQVYKWVPAN